MHSIYKLIYLIPFYVIINGVFFSATAVGQDTPDSLNVAMQADSNLVGFKLFFDHKKSPVSGFSGISKSKLYHINKASERVSVTWDTVSIYKIRTTFDGIPMNTPQILGFDEFAKLKKREQEKEVRFKLIEEGKKLQEQGRGLLDFKIKVPGGEKSAFTTIFGKPEVNLRVTGAANMNVGASIQKIDDATNPENAKRVDPTFNQNLQLNIQGTIGDKLTISTDWDTERSFDYENRLKIIYQGYEDEIIKTIELGNVSMQTGNSLIGGGNSLFGIKAVTELGPVKLTSVISQQKGKTNSQTIKGGAQESEIKLSPADYEDDRHFFLDFYNRQQYEPSMADPQQLIQAYQISELFVYVKRYTNKPNTNAVDAIALVDLGVNEQGDGTYGLPNNETDRFTDELLNQYRSPDSGGTNDDFGATASEFDNGLFELLQEGVDYTYNPALGYITLEKGIDTKDALAVSFAYTPPGLTEIVTVGDIETRGNERIYLKLIRPKNLTTDNKTWNLTMRNIYYLGVSNVTQDGFTLDIEYTRGNVAQPNLLDRNTPLLQDLGLDRVNSEGAIGPDFMIDFQSTTLDAGSGRIIFPYLEPFGSRINDLLASTPTVSDSLREVLTFKELYTDKQINASRSAKNNFYRLSGTSKGGVSGSFSLGFGLIEGSVKVFANGVELIEGSDYEVDYSFGSIVILNDRYLAPGQEISIEYENNQFAIIGQKNFTGLRAEYEVNKDISIGTTYFKLKEQPVSDKIRIGNEPINNTILGVDANARFDTPWMTRFIDKVPLLQTKESSDFSISGEFAQLRPGVSQTNAVRDAIAKNQLYSDEENGLVFIDDFEGSEFSISFLTPSRWRLATAPAAIPGYFNDKSYFDNPEIQPSSAETDRKGRSDLRAEFSWYSIPRNVSSFLGNVNYTPETEVVRLKDVFPGRETNNPQEDILTTLDLHYNPLKRGPYNYNPDMKTLLEDKPDEFWGGMTAVIPSGQEDLAQNNIEFLEFWVQSILPDGQDPAGLQADYDGKIYIDLGVISEDIIPNVRLNTEDGMATFRDNLIPDDPDTPRSFISPNNPNPNGSFSQSNRDLEDVGLDGAANPTTVGANGKDEATLFADFIEAMRASYGDGSEEFQAIEADPSNDDYVYYGQSKVQNLKLQERFYRLWPYHEGNTPVTSGDKKALTLKPDTEGLVNSSAIEQSNSYYQYEIQFNPADINNLQIGSPGTYIVDRHGSDVGSQTDRWYLVRVPLIDFKRKIGEIVDFQNISYIRFWMSGYKKPFTLRFATFEFVGSQWKKVDTISETPATTDNLRVSTINIEENASREPIPYRQPEGSIRAVNRGAQVQSLANEQSLVLEVENLGAGEIQMVKRVYPSELNLLNYSNLRMFVHGEGFENRGDAELVIRMGTDLENNYYEYRQPVTPTDPNFPFGTFNIDGSGDLERDAEAIWLYDENSTNIVLSAFNQLKQFRALQDGVNENELFEPDMSDQAELLKDAVPGAVIAVKGNPSLNKISEIGIGIKNPFTPNQLNVNKASENSGNGVPILNAEFWLNELRVSGFDNENGWAANAKASLKLADFAKVNTNFTKRTSGYGDLESRLGQRYVSDDFGYSVSSTVNLHKLIPDRFGWNFPVTVSNKMSTSTPKYLPDQGDTRLEDYKSAINAQSSVSDREKQQIIDDKIHEVQTVRENFSLNISNISKVNSKSKLAQYTLDNTKLSYVYNQGNYRSPTEMFKDDWNYTASIQYNLSLRNVKLFRPFAFTEPVPVVKVLSGLRLGYMPSSVSMSSRLTRSYTESRRRILGDTTHTVQPLKQTHNFTQDNAFGFKYNLTPSITTSYSNSTNFDLSSAGIESRNVTGVDSLSYRVRPTFEVFKGIINDTLSMRRSNYKESYAASWRPKLNNIKPLNWVNYTASYGGGYQWVNSARGSGRGAQISNTLSLDQTVKFSTDKLFDKVGFVSKMEQADKTEANKRRNAKKKTSNSNTAASNNKKTEKETPQDSDILQDMKYFGRKLFLAMFSMRSVDVNYRKNKSASQQGYAGMSQIFYTFNSENDSKYSPPMGYRLGIDGDIPESQLIDNRYGESDILAPARNTYSDNLTLGTRLNIFQNFTVDLDWDISWNETESRSITIGTGNDITSVTSASGGINSSSWVFGSGYGDLFKRQMETAFADMNVDSLQIIDSKGNRDGRTVLDRKSVQEDFKDAYLGGGVNEIGSKNFIPFPRPNWRVNWSGVEKYIPVFGKYMKSAQISHAYKGSYGLDWSLNAVTGEQSPQSIGNFNVTNIRGKYEPTSVNIIQNFSPLVRLNVTWNSTLRTEIGYNKSNTYKMALSSKTVNETSSNGFNFSVKHTFRKVKIPIFPNIKNNIDLTLNGSYFDDSNKTYYLDTDLDIALGKQFDTYQMNLAEYTYSPPTITGQKRWNGSFVLGYRISNTVQSNFEYTYSKVVSKSSVFPPRTNHDIRFNVRIAINSR